MSLSPSDDGDRKRLASSIDEEGISVTARMYELDGDGYKLQKLSKAIRLCGDTRIRISPKVPYDLVNGTVYVSQAGLFKCVGDKFYVRGVWKPCVITISGEMCQTLHKSYNTGENPEPLDITGYTTVKVDLLVPYHGPTRTLESIADAMMHYSAATDVVAYKTGHNLYNVAFVHENKWKCIVCNKEFDRPVEWADHYDMTIELPYGSNAWHAVHINDKRNPVLSRVPYRGGICGPVKFHAQGTLYDKRFFWTDKGEPEPCPRKFWGELMSGMETNVTVSRSFLDAWKGVQSPTWTVVGDMITARVKEARESWSQTIGRTIWNDWKPDPKRANGGSWLRVENHVAESRRREYQKMRIMDDTIVKRQGRPTTRIPETKDKIHLEFSVQAFDTVWDVKKKIVKYRRTPWKKIRLYYKKDGEFILMMDEKTMNHYGVKGTICGYDVWLGRFNARIEEPPDELRTDVVTQKTIEYKKRFQRR